MLAKLGVDEKDFEDLRLYPEFAKQVAAVFIERRAKIEMALGRDETLALLATKELSDHKLLVYIAKWARLDIAAEAAMRKIPPSELAEIARKHSELSRVKIAARILPTPQLMFLLQDGFVEGDRRRILAGELAAGNY